MCSAKLLKIDSQSLTLHAREAAPAVAFLSEQQIDTRFSYIIFAEQLSLYFIEQANKHTHTHIHCRDCLRASDRSGKDVGDICLQRAGRVCVRPGDLRPSGCPYRLPCIGEARLSNKHRAVTLRHGGSMLDPVCVSIQASCC